jgi:undecaprenyl-diphosphatase
MAETSVPPSPLLARIFWALRRVEGRTLLTLIGVGIAIWGFLSISGEVLEAETLPFDRHILLMLRNPADLSDPIGPRWFEEAMRDVTALGGFTVLTLVTVITVTTLLFYAKRRQALVVAVTIMLAELSSDLLKLVYDRPRPTLVPHGSWVYSHSFPSGHSTLSAATYLTIAAVLGTLDPRKRTRAFVLSMAVLLVLSIGTSRVYLGVHWPTDVLAGWLLGGAWALAARLALAISAPQASGAGLRK